MVIDIFQSVAKSIVVKKGEYLFRQGDRNDSLFYIEKGLLKAFYQTHEGNEWVKSFLVEGDVIGNLHAVLGRGPNTFSLVCMENCDLWQVSGEAFLQYMNDKPEYYPYINQILINLAMKKERREFELLCLSAEERYQIFYTQESHLPGRLSQQEIAKYIGITPVGLSRIRRRLGLFENRSY